MKQHIFKRYGLLFVFPLALLCFFACKKDILTPNAPSGNTLTEKGVTNAINAQEAQQWFDSQNFADAKSVGLQPQWKYAKAYGKRVEIPILLDGKLPIKSIVVGDAHYLSKSRLVIYKKNATEYVSYILYFTPSKNFKGNVNAVNTDNYGGKKFDGKIFVADLGNKVIGAYTITNGDRGQYAQVVEPARGGVKLRGWECIYVDDYICAYGWGTELDPVTNTWIFVIKWICEPAKVEVCTWVSEDPCSSANPPSWCDASDPCNQLVPPPYCNSGDPCNGPNPPLYCNGAGDDGGLDDNSGCPTCTKTYGERPVNTQDFTVYDYYQGQLYLTLGDVTFSLALSGVDCKTGDYWIKDYKSK